MSIKQQAIETNRTPEGIVATCMATGDKLYTTWDDSKDAYWNSCTAMAALLNKLGESLEGWGGGGATRTGHVFCWFKHQPEPEPLANERSAKDIVNAIFSELSGRGGFDILDEVHDDAETYREMHAKCSERVLSAADGDVGKFDDRWNPKEEE